MRLEGKIEYYGEQNIRGLLSNVVLMLVDMSFVILYSLHLSRIEDFILKH